MIKLDIIIIISQLIACALLFFLAGFAEKYINSKWRICYVVPAVICLILTAYSGFEISMVGAYIGSLLPLIGFFREKKNARRIASAAGAAAVMVSFIAANTYDNYRAKDFTTDFKTAFRKMEEHYVLAEHKNIDWDEVYNKFLPKFEAATKANDEAMNMLAWLEFTSEFRDAHVCYSPANVKDMDDILTRAYDGALGNDYGLALMGLSDGRFAAINVYPALEAIGIRNGTVITDWDGKNPAELGAELTKYSLPGFADKDNEAFYRPLYGAGTGGESITVTYLDESGNEQTAVLPKIGAYYSGRMKSALETIDGGIDTGHLTWVEVNEDTAAFRVKMMMYDSNSMASDNYSSLKNEIVKKIEELKANGVKNIILDMRSNSGGSGGMVKAFAEIFSPVGEHYYATDGLWDDKTGGYVYDHETKKFAEGTKNYYTGEGLWDGEVVILVNSSSVSAADHTVKVLTDFDNITVMGFTESNGSSQGIGTVLLENGMLSFSSSLLLDENGDVFIDSGADYESGNDIEIRVPFDNEAIDALFVKGEDHLLNEAVEYLNSKE